MIFKKLEKINKNDFVPLERISFLPSSEIENYIIIWTNTIKDSTPKGELKYENQKMRTMQELYLENLVQIPTLTDLLP